MADLELMQIAPLELLDLWAELIDAEHGTNGFGGDTCELYAYRFGALGPRWYMLDQAKPDHAWVIEDEIESGARLHALLAWFAERRDVDIEVNGVALGDWLKTTRFDHRAHVRVVRKVQRG